MITPPEIVRPEPRPAAVVPLVVPRAQIASVMGPAIGEVLAAVRAQGLTPAGPVFAHHLRMPMDAFDLEVGVPVSGAFKAAGRVRPGVQPGVDPIGPGVARTLYQGPYEGLHAAWSRFDSWLHSSGYAAGSDLWECYLTDPRQSPDPSTWKTELYRPLVR